jgi:hypothetical protein
MFTYFSGLMNKPVCLDSHELNAIQSNHIPFNEKS